MSTIIVDVVQRFTEEEDKGFISGPKMIQTEDIRDVREWHLKGYMKDKYPKNFSLISFKDDRRDIKIAEDMKKLSDRINFLNGVRNE